MQNTLPVEAAAGYLAAYEFSPELALPARQSDGTLDLDELHRPVIERISARNSRLLPGLDTFTNTYPVPGSSPAMFHLLAEWKAKGKLDSIAVLDGEYEGYAAYSETLNIPVTRYPDFERQPRPGEMWFITNPNARDGNWIDKERWEAFVSAGHQIIYDAAYVGLTVDGAVDVSSPNIQAVLTSPSKIFGVFRHRYTGITYTREPIASLYGTKWLKSIPALIDTLKLYESFGPYELPRQYRGTQEEICARLGAVVGAEVVPSDTILIGAANGPVAPKFEYLKRGDNYRLGLTKLFEGYEAMQ